MFLTHRFEVQKKYTDNASFGINVYLFMNKFVSFVNAKSALLN